MRWICDLSPCPKLVKTDIILSLHHHLNIIFKMIKFILLALLCFSLNEEIFGRYQEDNVGSDGYRLEARFDDEVCCEDKKPKKNESPEVVTVCLDSKNSKKIADAVLNVLHNADNSYEAIKALRIPEFMVSKITYQEWAENIGNLKYNFVGFAKLQTLVNKYVLCKKVCKVFFYLRDSLRQFAARADLDEEIDEVDGKPFIAVSGNLVVLGDVRKDIELAFNTLAPSGMPFKGVKFSAETCIFDCNLLDTNGWAGKEIIIDCDNVIVPKTVSFLVNGDAGKFSDHF